MLGLRVKAHLAQAVEEVARVETGLGGVVCAPALVLAGFFLFPLVAWAGGLKWCFDRRRCGGLGYVSVAVGWTRLLPRGGREACS